MADKIEMNFIYMIIKEVAVVGSESILLKWSSRQCPSPWKIILKALEILHEWHPLKT